jgi:sugar O-acyltransferase (sialic acid O-acetyltransferase NeuD family)
MSSNKMQIVILGAGGTGLLMAESVSRSNNIHLLGFLDDDAKKKAHGYCDIPVLGGLSSWIDLPGECLFLVALYGAKKNVRFFQMVKSLGIPRSRWVTIVDSYASVSSTVTLGYGTYVGPGTVLEPMVRVGNLCAMLGSVYVGHDSNLADYVVCANSVSAAGGVSVGEASFLGANATVREYTKIGSHAVIGMGSVVLEDVADEEIVAGNPARPMRERKSELKSSNGASSICRIMLYLGDL